MPLSLKSRLSKLEHKGQISKEEYQELLAKLDGHDKQIKADAIDDCIKTLAKSEDTILSDRQYYTLTNIKEQK